MEESDRQLNAEEKSKTRLSAIALEISASGNTKS
jgi:hypothetical protein